MKQQDMVVLVDNYGNNLLNHTGSLSVIEKLDAHRLGLKHRAVSIFIFNDKDELLLQKRSAIKYHSPELWTNTCCTHTLPGESPDQAAKRRLYEEMGIIAMLDEVFTFSYRVSVGNDLIENEYDHVFFGITNDHPSPDIAEVSDWRWQSLEDLEQSLVKSPEKFSPWLCECFNEVIRYWYIKGESLEASRN
ncbi:isopentenyl-diphosphate Delta-isomerase [Chloroflexota bacterium]